MNPLDLSGRVPRVEAIDIPIQGGENFAKERGRGRGNVTRGDTSISDWEYLPAVRAMGMKEQFKVREITRMFVHLFSLLLSPL